MVKEKKRLFRTEFNFDPSLHNEKAKGKKVVVPRMGMSIDQILRKYGSGRSVDAFDEIWDDIDQPDIDRMDRVEQLDYLRHLEGLHDAAVQRIQAAKDKAKEAKLKAKATAEAKAEADKAGGSEPAKGSESTNNT